MSQDLKESKPLLKKPEYVAMSGQSSKTIKKWIRESSRKQERELKGK